MIELVGYSQDVPLNGNGSDAKCFLVFKDGEETFRVSVGQEAIADIVRHTAVMEARRAKERKELKEEFQEEDQEAQPMVAEYGTDRPREDYPVYQQDDEDGIPGI